MIAKCLNCNKDYDQETQGAICPHRTGADRRDSLPPFPLPTPCTLANMTTKYEAGKVYRVTGECIIETLQLIERLRQQPPADTPAPERHDLYCDLTGSGKCDCKPHTENMTVAPAPAEPREWRVLNFNGSESYLPEDRVSQAFRNVPLGSRVQWRNPDGPWVDATEVRRYGTGMGDMFEMQHQDFCSAEGAD